MPELPRVLSTTTVYEGRLFDISLAELEMPDGAIARRETIQHPGAVGMIAVTDEGRLLLVTQYRHAAGRRLLEIPAGTLEVGEEPSATAVRELQEEVGLRAERLDVLGELRPFSKYLTVRTFVYLARDLVESRLAGDETYAIEVERVPLANVIDKLDAERDHWARKEAELERDALSEVTLLVDPDLLQLLLTNLARNACQYNAREPVKVQIGAARRGEAWVLSVADNGIGIPDGEAERIFDDFYRSGAAKKTGERGSGLGLAICRKIMQAHDGSIVARRREGGGSVFEIELPGGVAETRPAAL